MGLNRPSEILNIIESLFCVISVVFKSKTRINQNVLNICFC